jgi:hypothetical protein
MHYGLETHNERWKEQQNWAGYEELCYKIKFDEENFGKAKSQAYQCWTDATQAVPCDITSVSDEPHIQAKLSGYSELAMKSFTCQI